MASKSCNVVPGDKIQTGSHVMNLGSNLLQSFKPVNQIHQHLCGIHSYDGEPKRQVIAQHYCSHLNEEVRQCLIYDSPEATARLIGVEFIISEHLFHTLPEEEARYWHSHAYEVKSGLLVSPGMPEGLERKEMEKLVSTYGKTWHFWQVDRGDSLPLGPAKLMMSLTRDGQVDALLLAEKDKVAGSKTLERREARADIPLPLIAPTADRGIQGEKKQCNRCQKECGKECRKECDKECHKECYKVTQRE